MPSAAALPNTNSTEAATQDASFSAVPAPQTSSTDSDVGYLPREALSVSPAPITPLILDIPAGVPDGIYHAELTVFIDELGGVRRVVIDAAPDFPEALKQHARQVFLSALFHPGQRDGKAVRARPKFVVEFESNSGARTAGAP